MRYNDQTQNPELDDKEVILNIEDVNKEESAEDKKNKAHKIKIVLTFIIPPQ